MVVAGVLSANILSGLFFWGCMSVLRTRDDSDIGTGALFAMLVPLFFLIGALFMIFAA